VIKKNNFKLIIISIMILGVLLLLLLNGCSLFRQYGSIEGYVYVPDTGNKGAIIIRDSNQVPTGYKPLPGAKVSVQDSYNFVFTDINGYFLLEDVITGLVSLIIEPPINSGYNSLTTQVMVEPDTTAPVGTYGAVSLPSEGAGYWDIIINQIDDSEYPEVKVYVSVIDPGNDIPLIGAISDNFELEINGIKISNLSVAQVPGTTSYPASISLVIDRSGSMEGEYGDDQPLIDAKVAAKTFVNLMGSIDRAEVISFGDDATVDQSFTSDKQVLFNAIDSLYSDGATALYDAIWQGLEDTAKETNSRKAVIALTDGGENYSSSDHGGGVYDFNNGTWLEYPDNSKLVDYASDKVKIPVYTIGLAGFNFTREKIARNYSTTENDLKEIADGTGGEYKYAPESEYLEYIYKGIKQRLEQQYIITFTDNTGITSGILTVKVNYNQMYGEASKDYKPSTPTVAFQLGDVVEVCNVGSNVSEGLAFQTSPSSAIIWRMIDGFRLKIVDNPQVADGLTWWPLEVPGGQKGWSKESQGGIRCLRKVTELQPSLSQVNDWLEEAARQYNLPPMLLKAIACQESNWCHYWTDAMPKTRQKVVPEGVGYSVGIMMVNTEYGSDEFIRLCADPAYNIREGARILEDKRQQYEGNNPAGWTHDDYSLIENWWYATVAYNGWGPDAVQYASKVQNLVENPYAEIQQYVNAFGWTLPTEAIPDFSLGDVFQAASYGSGLGTITGEFCHYKNGQTLCYADKWVHRFR
jgi:VWFA-related protein